MTMASFGPHLYRLDAPDVIVEPADDAFEIDDFTSLSDWEKFTAQVEHFIRENGLAKPSLPASPSDVSGWPWRQQRSFLTFYDFNFLLTWHYRHSPEPVMKECASAGDVKEKAASKGTMMPPAVSHLMSSHYDFPHQSHPIHYFYGLNEFVVFSPNVPYEKEVIGNQTRVKTLLSTLTVALNNTNCVVPFFVQVMDHSRNMFEGVMSGPSIRTLFRMAVLSKRPANCAHLSGLLTMFRSQLSGQSYLEMPSITVTVRMSYALDDWTSFFWSQDLPDWEGLAFLEGDAALINCLKQLPLGSKNDPLKRMVLHATWSELREELVTDNEVHSDLDAFEAPVWSVTFSLESQPHCILKEYLDGFSRMSERRDTMRQLLADWAYDQSRQGQDDSLDKLPVVFDRLTGASSYSLQEILLGKRGTSERVRRGNGKEPLKAELLTKFLSYLFPASDDVSCGYAADFESQTMLNASLSGGIKSSPVDGLVWRLTTLLAHCLCALGGIRAFAYLFSEFLLELRYHWEEGVLLPGIPTGAPDHAYCLLHQKLQMLNCCIEKKQLREQAVREAKPAEEVADKGIESSHSESESEEFFDCDDQEQAGNDVQSHSRIPMWSRHPEGRAGRVANLRLLEHDAWLYEPICQDPTPMTEDMLAEQAALMLQLGLDAKGAELRTRMQSASLLSDMESFKAANPGCVLADFVRWHSPRDWLPSDDHACQQAHLSQRMTAEGNIWEETWTSAKPVPARRQKRLFDDTREAERVFQFLSSLLPGEVAMMLTPNLLHASLHRLAQEEDHLGSGTSLKDISHKVSLASRLPCPAEVRLCALSPMLDVDKECDKNEADCGRRALLIRDAIEAVEQAEVRVSLSMSLHHKFVRPADHLDREQMQKLVGNCLTLKESPVLGASRGPAGQLIRKMFHQALTAGHEVHEEPDLEPSQQLFPAPESKEFILKTSLPRPYQFSAPVPQRMYCCVKDTEFRVAAAFSIDKQFL